MTRQEIAKNLRNRSDESLLDVLQRAAEWYHEAPADLGYDFIDALADVLENRAPANYCT